MTGQNSYPALAAIIGVLAVALVGASAAEATEFHTSAAPATLEGAQTETIAFEIPGLENVECAEATFEGAISETTTTEIALTPSFSGCSAFGFASADVDMTGCEFVPTATTTIHLECPNEAGIDITPTLFGFSVCTVKLTPFSANAIEIGVTVALEQYLHLVLQLLWLPVDGGCGAESGENASMTGKLDLEAFSEGEQVDLWVE